MDRRINGKERFVLCSIIDLESKRFYLVFLEGNGLLRGWATLVEKLWALGVVTRAEAKTQVVSVAGKAKKSFGKSVECAKKAFVDVAKMPARRMGNFFWLQLGGR